MKSITVRICKENIEITPQLAKRCPELVIDSIKNTVKHDIRVMETPHSAGLSTSTPSQLPETKEPACVVKIINEDVADAGLSLLKQGLNPVIINMASEKTPGGGWRNGALAQEESLFYRSLYYLALEDPWDINSPSSSDFYPLGPYAQIYTPNVYFFRSKQTDGFEILPSDQCFHLPCIAVSAIRKPELTGQGNYKRSDAELMLEKIRGIFKVALVHKHDSIVLSALGCGAFANPPEQVAELFNQAIQEYKKYFKQIVFAILDFGQSNNLEIFRNVISA